MVMSDLLLNALTRQKIAVETDPSPVVLSYTPDEQADAIQKAQSLRKAGKKVILEEQDV